jgi:hypothetical protein
MRLSFSRRNLRSGSTNRRPEYGQPPHSNLIHRLAGTGTAHQNENRFCGYLGVRPAARQVRQNGIDAQALDHQRALNSLTRGENDRTIGELVFRLHEILRLHHASWPPSLKLSRCMFLTGFQRRRNHRSCGVPQRCESRHGKSRSVFECDRTRHPGGDKAACDGESRNHYDCRSPRMLRTAGAVLVEDLRHTQRCLAHFSQRCLREREAASNQSYLRQMRQALRIRARPRRGRQNGVVARHLPFQRNLSLDPPHRRMEEEHRLDQLLREVRPVIPSLQMGQLMQHNLIQLVGREFFRNPTWKHNHRPHQPDCRGNLHSLGRAQRDASASSVSFQSFSEERIDRGRMKRNAGSSQRTQMPETDANPQQAPRGDDSPRREHVESPRGGQGDNRLDCQGGASARIMPPCSHTDKRQRRDRHQCGKPHRESCAGTLPLRCSQHQPGEERDERAFQQTVHDSRGVDLGYVLHGGSGCHCALTCSLPAAAARDRVPPRRDSYLRECSAPAIRGNFQKNG